MHSQNPFTQLPADIMDHYIIIQLNEFSLYRLRLVNKSMKTFVSKTLAGGLVAKFCEERSSYEKAVYEYEDWVLKEKNKNYYLSLACFFYGTFNQFANSALYACH